MKVGQRSLLGYLPAQVIKCVLDGKIKENQKYPFDIPMKTVSLNSDISGSLNYQKKFLKKVVEDFLIFTSKVCYVI